MLQDIEQINGININKGLKNVGHSESIYLELLNSFFSSCEDYYKRIVTAAQEGDLTQIKRVLHQLYGVSELLGVETVSNDCLFLLAAPYPSKCSGPLTNKRLEHLLQCLEELFNQYSSKITL